MDKKKNRRGFSLIEILVTTTIISLLAAAGVVSYSLFIKQSRDARRRTDIEQVRAALEIYRSNNNTYPVGSWTDLSILTAPVVYLQSLPADPKNPDYIYYYSGTENDYTVATQLESNSSCTSPPGGSSCGPGLTCNYCFGPYGKK